MALSLISSLLILLGGALNVVLGQPQDEPVTVIEAVAPVFPALAVAAAQDGMVVVDVRINAKGTVESVQVVQGPELLRKVVAITASRWVFTPTSEKTKLRTARLSFIFKLVSKETPSEELLPIFRPPYQVEIRTRYPIVTKDVDPPSKHKRRFRRARNNSY